METTGAGPGQITGGHLSDQALAISKLCCCSGPLSQGPAAPGPTEQSQGACRVREGRRPPPLQQEREEPSAASWSSPPLYGTELK